MGFGEWQQCWKNINKSSLLWDMATYTLPPPFRSSFFLQCTTGLMSNMWQETSVLPIQMKRTDQTKGGKKDNKKQKTVYFNSNFYFFKCPFTKIYYIIIIFHSGWLITVTDMAIYFLEHFIILPAKNKHFHH